MGKEDSLEVMCKRCENLMQHRKYSYHISEESKRKITAKFANMSLQELSDEIAKSLKIAHRL